MSRVDTYAKPVAVLAGVVVAGKVIQLAFPDVYNKVLDTFGLREKQGHKKQPVYNGPNPVPEDFDWTKEEPTKYRTFRNGEYKMTMGLKRLDPDGWFVIDKTYLEVSLIREKLLRENHDMVISYHESAHDAVLELYDEITKFMCQRYPKLIYPITDNDGVLKIYNEIRDEYIPLNSDQFKDPIRALELLTVLVNDDLTILIKNPDSGDHDEYCFRAGTGCFPAGFNPKTKLNRPLTTIHGPVPGYLSKLQLSMNKFFARLSPGDFQLRLNWSIQTHGKLFALTENHAGDKDDIVVLKAEELDFNKCFLRCEKQCFTRLPKTGCNLLNVKTYMYPLTEIRAEGSGETLCGAIDGLPKDLAIYKRAKGWGPAVKSYMRYETNGITDEIYTHKFET